MVTDGGRVEGPVPNVCGEKRGTVTSDWGGGSVPVPRLLASCDGAVVPVRGNQHMRY